MTLHIRNVHCNTRPTHLRMPFRYGIVTLTDLPHMVVQVEAEIDGKRYNGFAGDGLAPKWFTKVADKSVDDELAEMKQVIVHAAEAAQSIGPCQHPFDLWQQLYTQQQTWGQTRGFPALLWHFGVSLIERAAIDAWCRALDMNFGQALRNEKLGIDLSAMHQELAGQTASQLLPDRPTQRMAIRQTVGLIDPLQDADIADADRLDDGLPQSLAQCIDHYGLSYFKIKLPHDPPEARARLQGIAKLLADRKVQPRFSLDGNEAFRDMNAFRQSWQTILAGDAQLAAWVQAGLLFIEQPVHRDEALSDAAAAVLRDWKDHPPIIIDESDGDIQSLPRALQCGYNGTSHKNCKGVFKGIGCACLLEHRRRTAPDRQYVLSGEDLASIGPLAMIQDVTVAANLGLTHVERNGHHYFPGLSMWPKALQQQMLQRHGDVYHRHQHGQNNWPTLTIRNGALAIGSLLNAPFGCAVDVTPDLVRQT